MNLRDRLALDAYLTRGPADELPACPGGCGGDCDPEREDGLCLDCRPRFCDRCENDHARPADHLCAACHRELTTAPAPRRASTRASRTARPT